MPRSSLRTRVIAIVTAAGLLAGGLGALGVTLAPASSADTGTATLSLFKAIENLNTGASEGDRGKWDVRAVNVDTGQTIEANGLNGFQTRVIPAGSYRISEVSTSITPPGYAYRDWNCNGTVYTEPEPVITLAAGANLTCTVTNVAVAGTLSLVKVVEGGSAPPSMWTLTAQGPSYISGPANSAQVTNQQVRVNAGPYTLSESGGPAGGGHTASPWSCVYTANDGSEGTLPVTGTGQVTISLGQSVTCTITNTAQDTDAHLTLVKTVAPPAETLPDIADATDFTLTATPAAGTALSGTTGSAGVSHVVVDAGVDYTLGETGPAGYTASAWSCVAATGTLNSAGPSHVNLAAGADVTCTVTNTFEGGWLTLEKNVVDSSLSPAAWTLTAAGQDAAAGTTVSGASGSAAVTAVPVPAGDYGLGESGPSDGFTSGGYVCTGSSDPVTSVTVAPGEEVACTVTNTREPEATHLTLVKEVDNRGGGPLGPTAWGLSAAGPVVIAGRTDINTVTYASVPAGSYTLTEGPAQSDPNGYFPRYASEGWECVDAAGNELALSGSDAAGFANTVTLAEGVEATCTVTNRWTGATLSFRKQVINTMFGTHGPDEWTLAVTPSGQPDGPPALSGNGDDGIDTAPIAPGSYLLSEADGPPGYDFLGFQCAGATVSGNLVTIPQGADISCTATNGAIPPTVTLVKQLDTTGGGTATVADFTLKTRGPGSAAFSAPSGDPSITAVTTPPGAYVFSEDGPDGYEASWNCEGATSWDGTTAMLDAGQSMVCTATNTFVRPTLTLVKDVEGGPAQASDWQLTAAGATTTVTGASGEPAVTGIEVDGGSYELSEAVTPGSEEVSAGYEAGVWSCTDGELAGSTLTLSGGEDATCTLTNTWTGGTLTLVKEVADGGASPSVPGSPADWTLTADGPVTVSGPGGAGPAFVPAGEYTLSEALSGGPVDADYHPGAWSCEGSGVSLSTAGPGTGTLTVAASAEATCTLTNLFRPPHLTLRKEVTGGGPLPDAGDWTLAFEGDSASGSGVTGDPSLTGIAVGSGVYTLSESPADPAATPDGYAAGAWECTGGELDADAAGGPQLTLSPDDLDVVCTVTNAWQGSTLTLEKTVADGGASPDLPGSPHDWTLTAVGDGATVSGPGDSQAIVSQHVPAGSYVLSETVTPGSTVDPDYAPDAWSCDTSAQGVSFDADTHTLTLTEGAGADVVCGITNRFLPPHLTLEKTVTGGGPSGDAADWPLSFENADTARAGSGVTGDPAVTGVAVGSGTITLTETPLPGYVSGEWACTGAGGALDVTQTAAGTATVAVTVSDAAITCVIENTWEGSTLTLVKHVDDGGSTPGAPGGPADWTLSATGSGDAAGTEVSGPGGSADIVSQPVIPGDFALSETLSPGSTVDPDYVGGEWSCDGSAGTAFDADAAVLTVSPGARADITCEITNRFQPPHLTLEKTVIGGGPFPEAGDWQLAFDNPSTGRSGSGATGDPAITDAAAGSGTVALSETPRDGYEPGDWECTGAAHAPTQTGAGTATLELTPADREVSCALTNTWTGAHLTLVKRVQNGGLDPVQPGSPEDWTLSAVSPSGDRLDVDGTGGGFVTSGSYNLSEAARGSVDPGYRPGLWECTGAPSDAFTLTGDTPGAGTIELGAGADVTCTLANLFTPPHLTLRVVVRGGPLPSSDDWTAQYTNIATGAGDLGITGSDAVTRVAVGAGSYLLSAYPSRSDATADGYTASGWSCDGVSGGTQRLPNDTSTIDIGDDSLDVVCTIVYDWSGGTLTLVKTVRGGSAAPGDWTLSATPGDPEHFGIGGTTGEPAVTDAPVLAGSYALGEEPSHPSADLDEYLAGEWACTGGTVTSGSVTVAPGADVRCEIVNTFAPPRLTLVKRVVGGEARPDAWTLEAAGPTTVSGTSGDPGVTHAAVDSGSYALAERPVPGKPTAGYVADDWRCYGAPVSGGTVVLGAGDAAICTVTNRAGASGGSGAAGGADGSGSSGTAPGSSLSETGGGAAIRTAAMLLLAVGAVALGLARGARRRRA